MIRFLFFCSEFFFTLGHLDFRLSIQCGFGCSGLTRFHRGFLRGIHSFVQRGLKRGENPIAFECYVHLLEQSVAGNGLVATYSKLHGHVIGDGVLDQFKRRAYGHRAHIQQGFFGCFTDGPLVHYCRQQVGNSFFGGGTPLAHFVHYGKHCLLGRNTLQSLQPPHVIPI